MIVNCPTYAKINVNNNIAVYLAWNNHSRNSWISLNGKKNKLLMYCDVLDDLEKKEIISPIRFGINNMIYKKISLKNLPTSHASPEIILSLEGDSKYTFLLLI